jgi:hypothetical protein
MPGETTAGGSPGAGRSDGLLHQVQSVQNLRFSDLEIIADDATGVRVGIPYRIVGAPIQKPWGRNWKALDRRLSIDTLRYFDRSLDQVLSNLKSPRGRVITRESRYADGFVLEGIEDGGATTLYVEVRRRGNEIRGLSIVHSSRAQAELYPVIEDIKRSFVPFPPTVVERPPHSPPPQIDPRIRQLQQERDDLKDKLEQAQKELIKGKTEASKVDILKEAIERMEKALTRVEQEKKSDAPAPPKAPRLRGLPPGKRVALVVGINGYARLTRLETARNDAAGIGSALRKVGFSVIEAYDVDRTGFFEKWQQFLEEIEPGTGTAAFFFAGHGMQLPTGKVYSNYLLPVDTPGASAGLARVRGASISFGDLREDVGSRRPGLSLFILDACRENPFKDSAVRSIAVTRGLAPIEDVRGAGMDTFIMYSAGAGQLALDRLRKDGPDARHSVYVRQLLPLLERQHLSLQEIAATVQKYVHSLAATEPHDQRPEYFDGLLGPMCWSGHCPDRTAQK